MREIHSAKDQDRHRERALDAWRAAGESLARGEGVFTRIYAEAEEAIERSAARRRAEAPLSPIDGMPISVKDLFDVAGEPTMAGCPALAAEPPARADAAVIRRLRAAGAVIVGKTNMTQFALSGLGINPVGTPFTPWRRAEKRLAGGSSSGAAVSVADGMAWGAIGSDTGGSVRIPAAFCGLVGFKPTAARVSRQGVFALSYSLDSIGPLTNSVRDCALLDGVIADAPRPAAPAPEARIRLAIPSQVVLEGLDPDVARSFEATLSRLAGAGVEISSLALPELLEIPTLLAAGGFSPIEGWAMHAPLFERMHEEGDPRVMSRFQAARTASAKDYFDMLRLREDLIARAATTTRPFSAIVLPTVAMIPPRLADLAADEAYAAANNLALRNAMVANLLDRCAITIPCHAPGEAPVGLSLMGEAHGDAALLALAERLEPVIRLDG